MVVDATSRWVESAAIELVCFHTEDVLRVGIVAGRAIEAAGKRPGLRARSTASSGDRVFLAFARGQKVGFRTIGPPAIRHTIGAAIFVDDQEARFQPVGERGIPVIDGQLEVFDKYRAPREFPLAVCGECDPLLRRCRECRRLGLLASVSWRRCPTRAGYLRRKG